MSLFSRRKAGTTAKKTPKSKIIWTKEQKEAYKKTYGTKPKMLLRTKEALGAVNEELKKSEGEINRLEKEVQKSAPRRTNNTSHYDLDHDLYMSLLTKQIEKEEKLKELKKQLEKN